MTVIAVAGTASRSLPPERGTVRLRVVGEGATREEAVAPVRPALARTTADARAFEAGGEATRWSATSIATSVETRWRGDGREPDRVHVASAPVEVQFQDLDALRRWVGALLEEPAVRIASIDWSLTEPTRLAVERELRVEAAQDAAGSAVDYASALGLAQPRAVRLWEDGLRPADGDGPVLLSRAMTAAPDEAADLHPDPVVLEARVAVEFEASSSAASAAG